MCSPLVIAGIALSGASAIANGAATSSAAKARTAALSAERTRQQGYDSQAQALNTQSQDRYQNFDQQQAAAGTELGTYFQDQAAPLDAVNASAALPTTASGLVVQEEAARRGDARDFTNAQGQRLGQLRAFGDLMGDIGRDQARDATTIGQIGGFKRGSASLLPYDLDAASQKGAGAKMLGDVLGGLGSIATSAGMDGRVMGNAIPTSLEIKAGADPWRALRTTGAKGSRLGSIFGGA